MYGSILPQATARPTNPHGFEHRRPGIGFAVALLATIIFTSLGAAHAAEGDFALKRLRASCEAGTVRACAVLGGVLMERHAQGDLIAARAVYHKACWGGDGESCRQLSLMWRDGEGGPANPARFRAYAAQSCALNHGPGCFAAGSAWQENPTAPADFARALDFYARGCVRGVAASCHNMGVMLYHAIGVPKDLARARASFERACGLGLARGCFYAAEMTRRGQGGARNRTQAERFYVRACSNGERAACQQMMRDLIRESATSAPRVAAAP